jgi:hypothetical protein
MSEPTSDAANKPTKHDKGRAAKATPKEDESVKREREQEAKLTHYAAGLDVSQFGEMTLDDVAKVLSLTIKDDDVNKKIVFLTMLSAYTDQSQINASLNAPSATGKTYLATEIAKLFPDVDKVVRSGASPTSFFYGAGVFDKARNAKIVSLRRKILLFYEQPNPALQEKLRALLSHDEREITHALTNRSGGRNQTDMIIIEGFAATVFCSAGLRLDEQEATRAILISPEVTAAKIKQAIHLRARRGADEAKFAEWLYKQSDRAALKDRIIAIRQEHVDDIRIAQADIAAIEKRFLDMLHVLKPRNQRDIDHILQLVKVTALLNVWHRRQPDGTIMANQSDIDQAFALWGEFFESQNLGITSYVYDFYRKYIVPAYVDKFEKANSTDKAAMTGIEIGLTSQELSAYHLAQEETVLNNDQLRKQILPQLQSAGLIDLEKPRIVKDRYDMWPYEHKSELDRRTRHIFPKLLTDEEKKYLGLGGMGDTDESELDSPRSNLQELLDEIPD